MIEAGAATPDTPLEIDVYGQRLSARVQKTACLWDCDTRRIRA
jgi:hypothetical protein